MLTTEHALRCACSFFFNYAKCFVNNGHNVQLIDNMVASKRNNCNLLLLYGAAADREKAVEGERESNGDVDIGNGFYSIHTVLKLNTHERGENL